MRAILQFTLVFVLFISPRFVCAQSSQPARFPVKLHGNWGFIDRSGNLAIPAKFKDARDFYEGFAAVEYEGKWGFIDEGGRFSVRPEFEGAEDFDAGFAGVKVNGFWGFVDRDGQFTVLPQFESIRSFHNGSPPVGDRGDGHWQYVNETRTGLGDVVTDAPCGFSDGMAPVKGANGQYGLVDTHGQWVVQPQFKGAPCFSESRAVVGTGDKWGVIDTAGHFVVLPQFYWITRFTEGVAVVTVGSKEGMIRKDGSWLQRPQHYVVGLMSESRASYGEARSGWKRGFLDETGKVVINIQFNRVKNFRGGLAQVETDDGIGYIDRDGKYIWRPTR